MSNWQGNVLQDLPKNLDSKLVSPANAVAGIRLQMVEARHHSKEGCSMKKKNKLQEPTFDELLRELEIAAGSMRSALMTLTDMLCDQRKTLLIARFVGHEGDMERLRQSCQSLREHVSLGDLASMR